jgi:hypothetical protein
MPQIHPCARTTPAVRIEIARKWRKRRGAGDHLDRSARLPKLPWRATDDERAIVCAVRRATRFALGDPTFALRHLFPHPTGTASGAFRGPRVCAAFPTCRPSTPMSGRRRAGAGSAATRGISAAATAGFPEVFDTVEGRHDHALLPGATGTGGATRSGEWRDPPRQRRIANGEAEPKPRTTELPLHGETRGQVRRAAGRGETGPLPFDLTPASPAVSRRRCGTSRTGADRSARRGITRVPAERTAVGGTNVRGVFRVRRGLSDPLEPRRASPLRPACGHAAALRAQGLRRATRQRRRDRSLPIWRGTADAKRQT